LPQPPDLRLPRTVLPTAGSIRLAVDPGQPSFSGQIDMDVRIAEPVRVFWLHGQDLDVSRATLVAGGSELPLDVHEIGKDLLALRSSRALPVGAARLSVAFSGTQNPTEGEGLFRQQDRDHWYSFTQFEPLYARRAFPCFDEPDVKIPWRLALEIPADQTALANTPKISEEPLADGRKLVTFAPTPSLPSYLVAFAVGPFELVDAGTSSKGAPIRIATPRGRSSEAAWAVEATEPLLRLLEDYFGIPYPFAKLDLVAVPEKTAIGAMENPGLITFGGRLILERPEQATIWHRRSYANVAAHEMAHLWFGDLVTMAWWDDLWLNEGLASWMDSKIVNAWRPEWNGQPSVVASKSRAMAMDSLKTARQIAQPIRSTDDIHDAFDGITYGKCAAVVGMLEAWVGEQAFREAVHAYLTNRSWGSARSADFLDALAAVAQREVSGPLQSFLNQVGVPLVSMELRCNAGAPPRLTLEQQRYLPLGSEAASNQIWQIPVCVRYADGDRIGRACTLLSTARADLVLEDAGTCPTWVLPNAGGLGYYRMLLKGDLLNRLLADGMKRLTTAERVGLVGDVNALVGSGHVPAGDALALVEALAGDEERAVVNASVGIAAAAREIIGPDLVPRYSRFVQSMFGARARALGWTPRPDEDEDTRMLRASIVPFVATYGEDATLRAEAGRLALSWLDEPTTVSADLVSGILSTAAAGGDRELYDRYLSTVKQTEEPSRRNRLLWALGAFDDPTLAKETANLLIGDDLSENELFTVMWSLGSRPHARRLVYEFVRSHLEQLIARLPEQSAVYLIYIGVQQCDPALRQEVAEVFGERLRKLPASQRTVAQALESMDLCIAHRTASLPTIEKLLRQY